MYLFKINMQEFLSLQFILVLVPLNPYGRINTKVVTCRQRTSNILGFVFDYLSLICIFVFVFVFITAKIRGKTLKGLTWVEDFHQQTPPSSQLSWL